MQPFGASSYTALPGQLSLQPGPTSDGQALYCKGMDGETMGGIRIDAWIQSATVLGSNCWLVARPNGFNTGCSTAGDLTSATEILIRNITNGTGPDIQFTITCNGTKTANGNRTGTIRSVLGGTTQNMTFVCTDTTTPWGWWGLYIVSTVDANVPGLTTMPKFIAAVPTVQAQAQWRALGI